MEVVCISYGHQPDPSIAGEEPQVPTMEIPGGVASVMPEDAGSGCFPSQDTEVKRLYLNPKKNLIKHKK